MGEGDGMRRNLAGKRVILTGASGGIGLAIAEALTAAGAKVALAARSADRLAEVEAKLRAGGADAVAVPCDVTVPADRERLVRTAVDRWGGLDVLVNNAGIGAWGHFQTSAEAINRRVLEANFFAPAELIRLAVPHLAGGVEPAIVNVTSMTGRRGMPAWPEYSASKAALVGLSEALRAEMARFGITVVTVVPGLTRSDLSRHLIRNDGRADIRYDRGMTPEYVAARVTDALRRGRREVVLGREARLMLLFHRVAPRLLDRLVARKVRKLYS
jgi:NAD(P)-dependent dehydrogenase (short-subunit alcohol dehydrogenase family)